MITLFESLVEPIDLLLAPCFVTEVFLQLEVLLFERLLAELHR